MTNEENEKKNAFLVNFGVGKLRTKEINGLMSSFAIFKNEKQIGIPNKSKASRFKIY